MYGKLAAESILCRFFDPIDICSGGNLYKWIIQRCYKAKATDNERYCRRSHFLNRLSNWSKVLRPNWAVRRSLFTVTGNL